MKMRCVVARTVDVASSFLICHLSIYSFYVIGYFFYPDDTPHIPNSPSKSLGRDHGSSVGEMDVIIELTPTSHVTIAVFSTVESSGVLVFVDVVDLFSSKIVLG